MKRIIVIPTNLRRSETTLQLIEEAKQVATVVLVRTAPFAAPAGVDVVDATDVFNFQTWCNRGLARAGDGAALVINDDVFITAASMRKMFDALKDHDIVTLPKGWGVTPLSGHCFGLRPSVICYDESYHWWYGDDDLWERAVASNLRIATVDVPHTHDRGGHPRYPRHLRAKVMMDRRRFARLHRGGSVRGLPQ
jgi:hypothetical protein